MIHRVVRADGLGESPLRASRWVCGRWLHKHAQSVCMSACHHLCASVCVCAVCVCTCTIVCNSPVPHSQIPPDLLCKQTLICVHTSGQRIREAQLTAQMSKAPHKPKRRPMKKNNRLETKEDGEANKVDGFELNGSTVILNLPH